MHEIPFRFGEIRVSSKERIIRTLEAKSLLMENIRMS